MKLLSLLMALLIIVFIINIQLTPSASTTARQGGIDDNTITAPKVPSAAKDIKTFEQDINQFMLDAAEQRKQQADQY